MEITASSIYNWETIKKYNFFHTFSKRKIGKLLIPTIVIVSIVMVLCTVLSIVGDFFDRTLLYLDILVIVLVFLEFFIWFAIPKISFKMNKLNKNFENHYTFKEDSLNVSGQNSELKGTTEISYQKLNCICETFDFFYIYINSRMAFIVDKSTISGGTEEQLRNYLIKAVGDKKYKYYYK